MSENPGETAAGKSGPDAVVFAPFTLDLRRGQLTRGGEAIPLRPKTWAVLLHLAQRPGLLVSREELLDAVWPGIAVTPDTLTKSIGELRTALGDDVRRPRFLETVHRRGFRFRAAAAPAAPGRAAARPFVGRTAELQRLDELLHQARTGQPQLAFVSGPAGVGKTALVEVFLEAARADDPTLAVGRGGSAERHGPREAYMPMLEALGRLEPQFADGRFADLLRRAAPHWLAQLPWLISAAAPLAAPAAAAILPERMLREFGAFVAAVTQERTLVLVLEDLHWSDPSTVDLLSYLGQRRDPGRLLLLATYRPAEAALPEHPLVAATRALRATRAAVEIGLRDLQLADMHAYLAARFPGSAAPPQLGDVLFRHTGGNPLFLRATVDHMRAQGWILDTTPGWSFDAMPEHPELGVPRDAHDTIALQIASLAPADRRVLEAIATAGQPCTAAVLATVLEQPRAEIETTCETLAAAERVLRVADAAADGATPRYAFLHELYRRAVYEDVPRGRRQRLHQRLGAALAAEVGEFAAELAPELALHCEHGGDIEQALAHLAVAAARARQRSAAREAIGYLEHAVTLAARLPSPEVRRRGELAQRLALAPLLNEHCGVASQELLQNAERALDLCESLGPSSPRFLVLQALCHVYSMRGDEAALGATLDRLDEIARQEHRPDHRVVADSVRCRCAMHRGQFDLAVRLGEAVLAAASGGERPAAFGADPVLAARNHAALSLAFLGDHSRTAALLAASRREAVDAGATPLTRASVHVFEALLALVQRRTSDLREASRVLLALTDEFGLRHFGAMGATLHAWTDVQSGAVRQGLERLLLGQAAYAATGAQVFGSYICAFVAEAHRRAGDTTAAADAAAEGLRIAETTLDRSFLPVLLHLNGELLLAGRGAARRRAGEDLQRRAAAAAQAQGSTVLTRRVLAPPD